MTDFLPTNLSGWLGLTATVLAGLWAVLTFHRSNRIKAAEILIAIEKEYAQHLHTFLEVENLHDYERLFRLPIEKTLEGRLSELDKEESEAINRLEGGLRYLFVCASVKRLGVDAGAIDRMCAYNLHLIRDEQERRPGLREYVERWWPTLYFWAPLASRPWPKRIVVRAKQARGRFQMWWNGS